MFGEFRYKIKQMPVLTSRYKVSYIIQQNARNKFIAVRVK